jgi:hypothetical protein
MSGFNRYIPPLVEPETNPKKWFSGFKNFFSTLYHGIIPHKNPKEAELKLTEKIFKNICDKELETFHKIATSMYDDSKNSILSIEEKSFKLLTYISALSAILFFFLSKERNTYITVLIIISLTLLVTAIVVSLRCVNLKYQKSLYINTTFNFGEKVKPYNIKHIISELMNFAVFNRNVANNTADILKSARYFVSLGIIFTFISLILFFTANNSDEKITKVSVSFDDQTIMSEHIKMIELQSVEVEKLNTLIDRLNKIETEKNDKIDSLITEIKSLQTVD